MDKKRRFLMSMYVYKFFDDLIFIYPFYVLLMQDSGLAPLQISIALLVWSATSFFLEVPSGVVADKYSRKHVLLFAQICRIIGYCFWLFMPNFIGFVVGFVLWGVKSAFTSGTYDALVYDELKSVGAEREYTKVIGRVNGLAYLGLLLSSLGASVAIQWGYAWVLVISLVSLGLSSLAILTVPKAKPIESTHESDYFSLLKQGITFSWRNQIVLGLILFIALIQGLGGALDEYWSVFASSTGLHQQMIAIFIAAYGGTQFIASNVAHYFSGLSRRSLYLLVILQGIVLVAASVIFTPLSVLFLLLFSLIFKIVDTVFQAKLQDELPSHIRATTSSVKGFFVEIVVMMVYFGFGLLAQNFGNQATFTFFGVTICVVGLFYALLKHRAPGSTLKTGPNSSN